MELLKQNERGSVSLIRHKSSGTKYILRSFRGNADVYRQLVSCSSPYLPTVYEVASREYDHLILEEYVSGDNMGTMLKEALFTPKETRRIVRDLCYALWVLHSMGAVHRDVKPENVLLREGRAVLIDFDAARFLRKRPTATPRSWELRGLPLRNSTDCPSPTPARIFMLWAFSSTSC